MNLFSLFILIKVFIKGSLVVNFRYTKFWVAWQE